MSDVNDMNNANDASDVNDAEAGCLTGLQARCVP